MLSFCGAIFLRQTHIYMFMCYNVNKWILGLCGFRLGLPEFLLNMFRQANGAKMLNIVVLHSGK
ncbi:hypothetical protein GAMM_200006 [Gammaproteobacteria bacterium]